MPPINDYQCDRCGFSLRSGWGGYMYVIAEDGLRIPCPHPCEMSTVYGVLGRNAPRDVIRSRTGFNSFCLCLDCLRECDLDIGDDEENPDSVRYWYGATMRRDERKCPHCGSANVKTVFDLIGQPCPRCKEGIMKETDTGIIS